MTAHIQEAVENMALPSDRATQATPQAPTGLGPPVSVPSAAMKVGQRFTVKDPHVDYAFSSGSGMLRLSEHTTSSGGCWWNGDFVDYRGIVSIQMEDTYTRLDAVAGNRCHVRTWGRAFADNTLAKLCRAFLTDLHGAVTQGPSA